MTDARSFGEWLMRERDRRGITVRSIADRTKIGSGLLEALERGDVSRWPAGIYRRAFVRAYANAIGLDADLVLANFERLFPDVDDLRIIPANGTRVAIAHSESNSSNGELRLYLADSAMLARAAASKRACLDVAFAVGVGLIGFWAAGPIGFWSATAVAALVYHVCGVLRIRGETARVQPPPETAVTVTPPIAPPIPVMQFSDEMSRPTRRLRWLLKVH
jgi:transcriptional regulator with XRE-family HTH domain